MLLPNTGPLVLLASVFACLSAATPSLSALRKRAIADDVCGSASNPYNANQNWNAATWNKYNMGQWFQNLVKPYVVMNWQASYNGTETFTNIQDLVIYVAGKEGFGKCLKVSTPECVDSGFDRNLCLAHPEAHFVWIAIVNWANYLNSLYEAFQTSTIALGDLTSTLVTQFYTPQQDPQQLLVPIGILSGLAAAISSVWPPAAVGAGAGSIVNAALTQAGLNRPDPLVQWGEVQTAVGASFQQIQGAVDKLFNNTLNTLPGPPNGGVTYDADPTQLPQIFKTGAFAGQIAVDPLDPTVYGALSASAINALWLQDKVFIIKFTDHAINKAPAGTACKLYPDQTICLNGVAYLVIRWQFDGGDEISYTRLDTKNWNVWGAYANGSANGQSNKDQLSQYGLTLEEIVQSSERTQDKYGFLYDNQNGATIDQLQSDPTDLKIQDIMFWNIPICDIDAIIGQGKHLNADPTEYNDSPIIPWAPCTCPQAKGWPGGDNQYPPEKNDYIVSECQSKGWGSG